MKLRTYLLSAACVLSACEGSTSPPGPPAGILAAGSAAITVTVGTAAADSIAAKVVDADGRAVPNAQVTWSVDSPGGVTVSPVSGTTDAQGIVRAAVSAGTLPGIRTVRAGIASTPPISLAYTVTVNPGPAAALQVPPSLALASGTSGTVPVAAVDAFGNATSAAGLTWTSSNTSVANVSTTGALTAQGLGTSTITARVGQVTGVTQVRVVPAAIIACETNTATLCTTWRFADGRYDAQWDQGSQAVIQVERFDADSVRFARVDPSGSSAGLSAVYRGARGPSGVQNGVVRWTQNGFSFSGTWNAAW
jgi:hypothetical protein